jgi:hypothetical protein
MKRIIGMLLFTGLCVMANAQSMLPIGNMQSANQQLIESAVVNGLFVVHRCYQLQDTTTAEPSYFGWNNFSYFGDTYSLGVKVRNGYYSGNMAAHPWMYDIKYEEYRNRNRYVPVISESYYRQVEDTAYQTLPLKDRIVKEISSNRIYFVQDTLFQNKGFEIDNSDGIKKGWLVWAVTEKPLAEQNNQAVSFLIYRAELVFESGKESYDIKNPSTDKVILGGIYLLPKTTGIGEITFQLTGYLHREDSQWQVIRPANHEMLRPLPDSELSNGEAGLTPIPIAQEDNESSTEKNKKKTRRRK